MATTTTVKTAVDTLNGYFTDLSITAALLNADSPSGLIDSFVTLAENVGKIMSDSGMGQTFQRAVKRA